MAAQAAELQKIENAFTQYVENYQGISTTDEILKFVEAKFPFANSSGKEPASSTQRVINSLCGAGTQFVLGALATPLSAVVNLSLFISKLVMALVFRWRDPSDERYLHAQKLAEDAFFHLFTAVYDFALNFFMFVRLPISLLCGFMPQMTRDIHEWIFRVNEGEVLHKKGASQEEREKERQKYSLLRSFADAMQCMTFPDNDVDGPKIYFGRASGAFAAISRPGWNRWTTSS